MKIIFIPKVFLVCFLLLPTIIQESGCKLDGLMHRMGGDGSAPGFMKEMNDCISDWLLTHRR